ncbi:MAG: ATP-dependent DNA helicase RecG [Clostridia bacterium]|nr:ATP-dependent DNA helicase RecG [Clostridia bacterium]
MTQIKARNLDKSVTCLYGVSTAREKSLSRLGIESLEDLIYHFPASHENRGEVITVDEVTGAEYKSLMLEVITPVVNARIKSKGRTMSVQKFVAGDETGSVKITCFNRDYLGQSVKVGNKYRFYGIVQGIGGLCTMTSPDIEPISEKNELLSFVPKYHLTQGLTSKLLANLVKQAYKLCKDEIEDYLTEEEIEQFGLCTKEKALYDIHFPSSCEALENAKKRLAFDELYAFQLNSILLGRNEKSGKAYRIPYPDMKKFTSSIPFELTKAQKKTVHEILKDMSGQSKPCDESSEQISQFIPPARRLVQGDVGSGKTVVAFASIFACAMAGYQSALMVPTGILARQHFEDAQKILCPLGIKTALLTGATKASEKKEILRGLKNGEIQLIVGTHALIEDNVEFKNIALAVTDEQHRFGVGQRKNLEEKGKTQSIFPHTLVMSATPIPRTLAMIMYCDLDISVIDELPKGRQKIDTFAVGEDYHARVYNFIRERVKEGRQAYVVCPLAQEKNAEGELISTAGYEMKSAKSFCEKLQKNELSDLRVEYVHGKMKQGEKDEIMGRFADGKIDVLVSTTVIEVGVNVPNSVVMLVENAERFGLSQLHQLRGRVGRGEHKSYCILVSPLMNKSKDTDFAKRIKILCDSGDGFEIAKKDLEIRGPGEFFGRRQHGELCFKMADAMNDVLLLEQTKNLALKHISENRNWEMEKIGL